MRLLISKPLQNLLKASLLALANPLGMLYEGCVQLMFGSVAAGAASINEIIIIIIMRNTPSNEKLVRASLPHTRVVSKRKCWRRYEILMGRLRLQQQGFHRKALGVQLMLNCNTTAASNLQLGADDDALWGKFAIAEATTAKLELEAPTGKLAQRYGQRRLCAARVALLLLVNQSHLTTRTTHDETDSWSELALIESFQSVQIGAHSFF